MNFQQKKLGLSMTAWLAGVALMLSGLAAQVYAQAAEPAGDCVPGADNLNLADCYYLNPETGTRVGDVYSTPADLVNILTQNIFIVAGIIFFVAIIFAGISYVREGQKGIETAKQVITTALVGLIVMISAYWIVQIMEIVTGTNIAF